MEQCLHRYTYVCSDHHRRDLCTHICRPPLESLRSQQCLYQLVRYLQLKLCVSATSMCKANSSSQEDGAGGWISSSCACCGTGSMAPRTYVALCSTFRLRSSEPPSIRVQPKQLAHHKIVKKKKLAHHKCNKLVDI
jgi:hypothetical protein